jgi:hypothetical protein
VLDVRLVDVRGEDAVVMARSLAVLRGERDQLGRSGW